MRLVWEKRVGRREQKVGVDLGIRVSGSALVSSRAGYAVVPCSPGLEVPARVQIISEVLFGSIPLECWAG